MRKDRKKAGLAFWAAVGLALVLLYVASYGPVVWPGQHEWLTGWALESRWCHPTQRIAGWGAAFLTAREIQVTAI